MLVLRFLFYALSDCNDQYSTMICGVKMIVGRINASGIHTNIWFRMDLANSGTTHLDTNPRVRGIEVSHWFVL
jgi:hypothetical protein